MHGKHNDHLARTVSNPFCFFTLTHVFLALMLLISPPSFPNIYAIRRMEKNTLLTTPINEEKKGKKKGQIRSYIHLQSLSLTSPPHFTKL